MTTSSKIFTRDATGLVRTLSFFDQFVVSQAIIVLVNGFVLTALFAPVFFPGANLSLVFVLGSIPAFAMAYVYSKMSAAMPRSGGDYVWSTRILGPIFGSVQFVFLLVTTIIVGVTLSTWSELSIALSQLLFAVGVTTNNSGLVQLAISFAKPGPSIGYAIAVILIIFFTSVALLGLRVYSWFQRGMIVLYYVTTAGFIAVLLSINSSTIPGLFNHAMQVAGGSYASVTYSSIINQAAGSSSTSFSLTNSVLAAIPWGFLTFTGFNYGTYLAGETKSVKSSMYRALFLSVIVTIVLLVILAQLVYNDFGSTFLNSASYVQANNASELPTLPTTSFLASLSSTPAAIFVGLSLFIGWIVVCVAYIVTISRMIFASSFDRLLPSKFSEVSDRFHSPQWAVALVGVLCLFFISIYWNSNSFFTTWLNFGLVAPLGYLLPLFATLLFPFVKPQLFRATAANVTSRSALVVASLIGVASFAFYLAALSVPILSGVFLGAGLTLAYSLVAGLVILGLVVYAVAHARARSSGLDLKKVYSEIPPE